ncbi:uncharacterized protein ColSpa_06911 [Colletotrichum spaethianum]|uniref:Uncharacterized protein n=1 Tax=Colletotrichum spaethianum TaxID=700344 RepID=A0AA37P1G4_9PEZI|nr:uncharacterized protein ColSpa_06911 [Colletotrichum spaethianum]GKT46730.1 hypothetical protein ColSpa_06911 [Colletotrichum spaethianum]
MVKEVRGHLGKDSRKILPGPAELWKNLNMVSHPVTEFVEKMVEAFAPLWRPLPLYLQLDLTPETFPTSWLEVHILAQQAMQFCIFDFLGQLAEALQE